MAEPGAELVAKLPHRPPMRFIDAVIGVTASSVTCRSTITEGHIMRRSGDGRVPALVAIELFAQSAAALMMHRAGLRAGPPAATRGILVGARTLDFAVDAFDVGDVLITRLKERYADGVIVQLAGAIERDGVVVANGAINVARS